MPGSESDSIMPDESLADPEMGFGEQELTMEPLAPEPAREPVRDVAINVPEPEPIALIEDADVPLDVEPDLGPDLDAEAEQIDTPDNNAAQEPAPAQDRLRVELSSSRTEVDALRDQNAQLNERCRELEARLQQSAPAGEVSRLNAQLAQTRGQHHAAESEVVRLRNDLAQAQAALEAAEAHASAEPADEMVEKRELDVIEAQLNALQAENSQLRDALKEAQGAENRTEHAHDALQRRIAELETENAGLRSDLDQARTQVEGKLAEIEQLGRDLANARKELADQGDAARSVAERTAQLDLQKAELDAANAALAQARAQIAELQEAATEAGRVPALEDRAAKLQEQLTAREKDVLEMQEKLDTEAARSYRLSQRRIPALNKEIEDAQEANREFERKLQKAELRNQMLEDQSGELKNRVADLERALSGAKARAQDTQIIASGDVDSRALADDELRRTSNRLRDIEAERVKLAETLRRLGEAHNTELSRHMSRAEKLEQESEQRFETLLGQRAQMRILRERVQNMLQVAEDLAGAKDGQRKVLLESLRKLAELPPEKN